jgi:peptidoglycan/LPS O-acetylase OafA/YrhL
MINSPSTVLRAGHLSELDGIRGMAALFVLLHHAFYIPLVQTEVSGLAKLISAGTKAGWLGVELFFVLSGFLITGILLESRNDQRYFRNFYARRALRIMPLYYAALLVLALCYSGSGSFVLLGSLYLTNFASLFAVPMLFGPLWSLSVEEHFYLLWPWFVRWTDHRRLAVIAALIVVVTPLARGLAFDSVGAMGIYYFSWFRFDGLALGGLLALFYRSRFCTAENLKRVTMSGLIVGAAIIAAGAPFGILSREQPLGATLLYTGSQLFFVGMIAAALCPRKTLWHVLLNWRGLTWCGEVSYCFYLVHVFCFHALDFLFARQATTLGEITLRAMIGTAAAFVISALSYRCFEAPLLRLKRHFTAHSSRQISTVPHTALKARAG